MRSLIFAITLLATAQAFAQSYVLQNTGRLLTIDKQGFIYDLNNNIPLDQVKSRGKNWLLTKNEGIVTVSSQGTVFRKPEVVLPKKIKAAGGIWMVGEKSELVVVAADGMVYNYTEALLDKVEVLTRGANWFIVKNAAKALTMITIDSNSGRYYAAGQSQLQSGPLALNIANIRRNGNNWFTDVNGRLYVVRADGGLNNKANMGVFYGLRVAAGNFFITSQNDFYVVLDNGMVVLPYLPVDIGSVIKKGDTFAWNNQGNFYTFAETNAPADRNAGTDPAVMDRLLRSIVKLTVEQPALDSVEEEDNK